MLTATVTEAKAQLSRLLARVRRGETVLITHRGRPVARLEPARGGEVAAAASIEHLVRTGVVRRGRAAKGAVLSLPPPKPKKGDARVLRALLDDRDEARV